MNISSIILVTILSIGFLDLIEQLKCKTLFIGLLTSIFIIFIDIYEEYKLMIEILTIVYIMYIRGNY